MTYKKIHTQALRLLALVLLLIGFNQYTYSRSFEGVIRVKGVVYQEDLPIDGAILDVFVNGVKSDVYITRANGRFQFDLDPNHEYVIKVSQFGKVSKMVKLNAYLPKEEFGNWEVGFNVELFDQMEGLDVTVLKDPIAVIFFDKQKGYFDYDENYSKLVAHKLDALKEQYVLLNK